MGLFSNIELSETQTSRLNSILPEELRRQKWTENDFKGVDSILSTLNVKTRTAESKVNQLSKRITILKNQLSEVAAKNIQIYNTDFFGDVKLFGMVDIGVVEKFGGASSGDRLANGAIGYGIELVLDDVFANSNIQEQAVNDTKLKLLMKARAIFPECNLLFKYEVDFRELGSSGNVFIYMRGTAAFGENEVINREIENHKKLISDNEETLKILQLDYENLSKASSSIPHNVKDIKSMLGD